MPTLTETVFLLPNANGTTILYTENGQSSHVCWPRILSIPSGAKCFALAQVDIVPCDMSVSGSRLGRFSPSVVDTGTTRFGQFGKKL